MGVIGAQSRNMPAKLKASRKLGGVKKKVPATIFGIFTNPKIVAVTFFFYTAFPPFSFKF